MAGSWSADESVSTYLGEYGMGGSTFAGKNMADGVEVGPWAKTDGSGSAKLGGSTSDGEIRW